jgi:hypothetical protein
MQRCGIGMLRGGWGAGAEGGGSASALIHSAQRSVGELRGDDVDAAEVFRRVALPPDTLLLPSGAHTADAARSLEAAGGADSAGQQRRPTAAAAAAPIRERTSPPPPQPRAPQRAVRSHDPSLASTHTRLSLALTPVSH